jgi:hypothetical protein
MNEAAQLQPGEAFLIRQRHVAKIKVRAIGDVQPIEEQQEEKRVAREMIAKMKEIRIPQIE